jgi:hypothetical protein
VIIKGKCQELKGRVENGEIGKSRDGEYRTEKNDKELMIEMKEADKIT